MHNEYKYQQIEYNDWYMNTIKGIMSEMYHEHRYSIVLNNGLYDSLNQNIPYTNATNSSILKRISTAMESRKEDFPKAMF